RLGEADNTVLGSAVGGDRCRGPKPMHGRRVDDRATAALDEVRSTILDAEPDTAQVHAQNTVPLFLGGLQNAFEHRRARVVVDDVDAPEGLGRGAEHPLDIIASGYVGTNSDGLAPRISNAPHG